MRFLVLAGMMALVLAGCGRMGAPSPPGPAGVVSYPRTYPAPQ